MNRNKFSIFIAFFLVLLAVSCADPNKKPIITFDDAGKGAYVKLVKETTRSFNFYDLANAAYTYSVEFVDQAKGAQIAEYDLFVAFQDNNPDYQGDKSKSAVAYKTFKGSDFQTASDGYKALSDITITPADLMSALGLTTADVYAGDIFVISSNVVSQDGSVHNYDNSSSTVQGSAFASHFKFNLPLVCPSDLAGNYVASTTGQSTDSCCPDETSLDNIAVTLTAKGGGLYEVSDWSAGLYFKWYEVYGIIANDPTLKGTISDVCGTISGKIGEPFGTQTVITGTASNGTITYTWKNGYDDTATVTLVKK